MKILALVLTAALVLVAPLTAEVWNDPAGVATSTSSQLVQFPRPMSNVLVLNDDATIAVYIRLFWCGDTIGDATSNSLEIKATKSRSFSREPTTEPNFYCALTVIAASGTPTIRVEAK